MNGRGVHEAMVEPTTLRAVHDRAGARFSEVAGLALPRNYGDPAAEYRAVRSAAGVVERGDRVPVRVWGRDPVRMMQGLLTADVEGAAEGEGRYAALLTPKGKMIAEMRVVRRPGGELLMDLDRRALDGALAHLEKFVP
ncbi:MAG: hypothetical protein ACODAE_09445, partial [Gemmatimonadota bacterium]